MLFSLPGNYRGLWSWTVSKKQMQHFIQRSITHQQWQSRNRDGCVNENSAAHPATASCSDNTILKARKHRKSSELRCGIPGLSKCLQHITKEPKQSVASWLREKPNKAKCVSANFSSSARTLKIGLFSKKKHHLSLIRFKLNETCLILKRFH